MQWLVKIQPEKKINCPYVYTCLLAVHISCKWVVKKQKIHNTLDVLRERKKSFEWKIIKHHFMNNRKHNSNKQQQQQGKKCNVIHSIYISNEKKKLLLWILKRVNMRVSATIKWKKSRNFINKWVDFRS